MLEPISQDLQPFNTLGLASFASRYVRLQSVGDLPALSRLVRQGTQPVVVLGGGSNVVLPERLDALVIHVANQGCRVVHSASDHVLVQVQAGHGWHAFVLHAVAQGWHGLENLALIPGTVGAAPVQNIGAYGTEVARHVHSVVAWNFPDQRLHELQSDECGFGYRDSLFKRARPGDWLIVAVRFRLQTLWQPVLAYPDLQRHPLVANAGQALTADQVVQAVCDIRRAKLPDPAVLGNAGSFFKNPVVDTQQLHTLRQRYPDIVAYAQPEGRYKLAAGWLIDQAGWKGRRMGPVGVHDRQALVLVHHGGGNAAAVAALSRAIQEDIFRRFGVVLEQEPVNVTG